MCCFISALLLVIPRLAILVWCILTPVFVNNLFQTWTWPLLGWIFVPWTTLVYMVVAPGGIIGFDWIIFGLAVIVDIATHFGEYYNREKVRYGDQIP
jgi:hypothetical protein